MGSNDDIEAELGNVLRTSLMAATRMGEQLARMRENQLRVNEAKSAQETRQLQARMEIERTAARAELAAVNHPTWWDKAEADDIAQAWQTASSWRGIDPEIEKHAKKIEQEVSERWGFDVANTGARPEDVATHLQRTLDAHAAAEHELSQKQRLEREALELLIVADGMRDSREAGGVEDVAADENKEDRLRAQATSLKDQAAGHEAQAAQHLSDADLEVKEAKMTADLGQGYPPRAATVAAGKRSHRKPRRATTQPTQEQSISR